MRGNTAGLRTRCEQKTTLAKGKAEEGRGGGGRWKADEGGRRTKVGEHLVEGGGLGARVLEAAPQGAGNVPACVRTHRTPQPLSAATLGTVSAFAARSAARCSEARSRIAAPAA